MAKRPRVLVDSGVIISALNSPSGTPAFLLEMGRGQDQALDLLITPYITAEIDAVVKRKFPKLTDRWSSLQQQGILQVIENPPEDQLEQATGLINDTADVPILAAAIIHHVEYLVTVDRKHFLDNDRLSQLGKPHIIHPTDLVAEFLI